MRYLSSIFTTFCLVLSSSVFSQGSAGSSAELEPRFLIDFPTAGALKKGTYSVDTRLEPNGGVTTGINVGMSDRFSFGVSYGGANIISNQKPKWNELPGINFRYRLYEETSEYPAVVIGLDFQGYGGWIDSTSRYFTKSPGIYVSATKAYQFLGLLYVSGGINYSLDKDPIDKDINFYLGVEKTINSEISIIAELNLANNDNEPNSLGRGKGYWNAGLRWSLGAGLTLGVDFKNLNDNMWNYQAGGRSVRLEYSNYF